jgi:hypothetical protein
MFYDNEDINNLVKNNYSDLDFSINQDEDISSIINPLRRRGERGASLKLNENPENEYLSIADKKKLTSKTQKSTDEIQEPVTPNIMARQNKDLNTTYVYKSEIIKGRKKSRDLGLGISGSVTQINQYIMITNIGKGGWGEVYLAIDTNTQTKYVVFNYSGYQGHQ